MQLAVREMNSTPAETSTKHLEDIKKNQFIYTLSHNSITLLYICNLNMTSSKSMSCL